MTDEPLRLEPHQAVQDGLVDANGLVTSSKQITALEDCVLHVAAQLSQPLSLSMLHEALPEGQEHDFAQQVRAAMSACEQAGMRAAFGKRELSQMTDALLPAVLILEGGATVVLHEREGEKLVIYDPRLSRELIEVPASALEKEVTGHVLTVQVEHRFRAGDRENGRERHWFKDAFMANRWSYTQIAIAAVLVNILAIAGSLFTMVVYDRILPSGATTSLIALALGVGVALFFDLIVKTLRASFIDEAGRRADLDIGENLFDHVMDVDMSERRGAVGYMASTIRESETLRDFFTSATMVAIVDLPFVLMFLGVIYLLAGPLVLVPAVAVPLVIGIGLAAQPVLSRLEEKIMSQGQAKQGVLVETLSGMETVKAIGAARQMRARWVDTIRRQSAYSVKSRRITQGVINTTGFIQQAVTVLVVVHGALLVVNGSITSGVLIAAVILTGRLLAPLSLISQTLSRLHQARSSYRSLDKLMKMKTEHPVGKTWLSRPNFDGGLKFDNVSFTYPGQPAPALDGVSFDIQPGEKVAILGSIGSGKSTVARMALGLYHPDEGCVMADGTDIRQIDPLDLRKSVGVVMQQPWLVSGSLRDNIALGSVRPTDEDILRAAHLAGVEEFAARHPDGYGMMLGERGAGLSGGQQQTVALARALVNDPPILIMDEPTASIDTQNEAELVERLKHVFHNRTLIVMTHRPSLLNLVDRVIVLQNGKVVADGKKQTGAPQGAAQPAPVAQPQKHGSAA